MRKCTPLISMFLLMTISTIASAQRVDTVYIHDTVYVNTENTLTVNMARHYPMNMYGRIGYGLEHPVYIRGVRWQPEFMTPVRRTMIMPMRPMPMRPNTPYRDRAREQAMPMPMSPNMPNRDRDQERPEMRKPEQAMPSNHMQSPTQDSRRARTRP